MNLSKFVSVMQQNYKPAQPVYFYTDPIETTFDKALSQSAVVNKALQVLYPRPITIGKA